MSEKTWNVESVMDLFSLPFPELMYRAQTVHRENFPKHEMQLSTLINIKDGGCPEDCHYCPQAQRYHTGVTAKKLMSVDVVRELAKSAKDTGATRLCMGAAWRELKDRDLPAIISMITEVKKQGLESCMTLGMLTEEQAKALKEAGLDFYNHNLDTSAEYYPEIITTRTYDERLDTLHKVKDAGINVCSGGILGLGESRLDRARLLYNLMCVDSNIESISLNRLVPVPGTPLENADTIDPFEFVRTIAVARIMFPKSHVRLSAGRKTMSEELHSLCFLAGANSFFYGEKLLMTENADAKKDRELLVKLGIPVETMNEAEACCSV